MPSVRSIIATALLVLVAAAPMASVAQPAKKETAPAAAGAKKETPPAATAKKEVTPQQQRMKDCSARWGEEKKTKNVSGKKAHNEFMSKCLKG